MKKYESEKSDAIHVFYIEENGKCLVVEAVTKGQELPDKSIGDCKDWEPCKSWIPDIDELTENATYRLADELAVKTWQNIKVNLNWLDKQDPIVYAEYMNTTYGADFCKNANEYRAVPQVELEIDGADGPSKYQTDIHKHIADKYEMSKDKKTKVIVKVIDPISKKEIDYDNNLQYKIQKVTNGFPEEYDRGEFEVKDGLGEFEFNTPKTKSHLFLKVKPPKGAMDEDGVYKSWHPDKYICLLVIK